MLQLQRLVTFDRLNQPNSQTSGFFCMDGNGSMGTLLPPTRPDSNLEGTSWRSAFIRENQPCGRSLSTTKENARCFVDIKLATGKRPKSDHASEHQKNLFWNCRSAEPSKRTRTPRVAGQFPCVN